MKDNDTYLLSEMYGEIVGQPATLVMESAEAQDELLTEELVQTLGQQLAIRLIRLIKARQKATHKSALQQLEKEADKLLSDIIAQTQDNPMVSRTVAQHRGMDSLALLNVLYNILKF